MMPNIKNRIRRFAQARGVSVSTATPGDRLQAVIAALRPQPKKSGGLIRIGASGDGGYLVPDDLDGIRACFSPGVDDRASFELDLEIRGIPSHLADLSVQGPPSGFQPKSFIRKYIGVVDDAHTITMETWVSKLEGDSAADLALQMDIEGAEYSAILQTPRSTLSRFRIIVIELHSLASLANQDFFGVFENFVKRLTTDHAVVHIHPNNVLPPQKISGVVVHPVLEVTLLRRDRLRNGQSTREFHYPHPLDAPNVPTIVDHALGRNWYRS